MLMKWRWLQIEPCYEEFATSPQEWRAQGNLPALQATHGGLQESRALMLYVAEKPSIVSDIYLTIALFCSSKDVLTGKCIIPFSNTWPRIST